MRKTLAILVLGIVLGAAATSSPATWEYHTAPSRLEAMDMVNSDTGWQIVPGQPDPLHLRRWRLLPHR